MQKNIIFALLFFLLLEVYVFQAFKTITSNNTARWIYIIITACVYLFLFSKIFSGKKLETADLQFAFSIFLIAVLPKIIAAIFLLFEDIFRLVTYIFKSKTTGNLYPERRKFLSVFAFGAMGILAALFTDGIIFGKFRHTVRRVRVKFTSLPDEFKGYKIVQISDVHSGSFSHPEKLRHAINLINKQDADLVLFTGDMVNNLASEFLPFIPLFSDIKSKDGKFSVLGNHDYGFYAGFNSAQSNENINQLAEYQKKAGFRMLRNENIAIERAGKKIHILGVDNWGEKPFPQFGDIDAAVKGLKEDDIKILMSHDPTHFDHHVKNHPANVQLTLSGHTHGMQFGIDLKNFRWSPVEYRYKKWADLYESAGKLLYVNRGFGVLGYPGRVGINPEITLFELI